MLLTHQGSTGSGVEAQLDGLGILPGSCKLIAERRIALDGLMAQAEYVESEGRTVMCVVMDGKPAGIVAVADTLEETSVPAIMELHRMAIQGW